MSVDAPSSLDLNRNIVLKFEEPVEHIDTAAIHMAVKVDSLWEDIPFILMADSVVPRQYQILADWQPGQEYQLKIDSLGIKGIYGLYTNKVENQLKVKTLEDYGTLYLNIVGAGPHAVVQLLNSSDGVVRQQPVTDKNTCDFYFCSPARNITSVCSTMTITTGCGIPVITQKSASRKKCTTSRKCGK